MNGFLSISALCTVLLAISQANSALGQNITVPLTSTIATLSSTSIISTATPTDIAPGSLTNCSTYYDVQSGDSCNLIEDKFNLAFVDFLRWNPEVNTDCTNLQLEAYCVAGPNPCASTHTVVLGEFCAAIESQVGITDAQLRYLNPWLDANCDLQVGQNLCIAAGTSTTTSVAPAPTDLEPGSWNNCTTYYDVQPGDNCTFIDTKFNIAFSDFLHWNPEVATTCDNLFLASYCVKGSDACQKIYTVALGDFCSKIESSQGISDAQLRALNPWIDAACDIIPGQNLCVA